MRSVQRAARRLPSRAGWPRTATRSSPATQIFSRMVSSVSLQPITARYQIWNFVIPRSMMVVPVRPAQPFLTQPIWTRAQLPPILLCPVDTEGEARRLMCPSIGVARKIIGVN